MSHPKRACNYHKYFPLLVIGIYQLLTSYFFLLSSSLSLIFCRTTRGHRAYHLAGIRLASRVPPCLTRAAAFTILYRAHPRPHRATATHQKRGEETEPSTMRD
jgi:hypothetical protein